MTRGRNDRPVTGTGLLFFNAYGAIQTIDVDGEYVVDNGFAVAWEPTLQFHLTRARKIRSFLFANQIMLRYTGRGRLWVSRAVRSRWRTGLTRSAPRRKACRAAAMIERDGEAVNATAKLVRDLVRDDIANGHKMAENMETTTETRVAT